MSTFYGIGEEGNRGGSRSCFCFLSPVACDLFHLGVGQVPQLSGGTATAAPPYSERKDSAAMTMPPMIAANPIALASQTPFESNFSIAITAATATITARFMTPSTSCISMSAQQQAAQKAPW